DKPLSNFHLIFLIKLSRFLGSLPLHHHKQQYAYFDLVEGVFTDRLPAHTHVLQEPHTAIFYHLLQTDFEKSNGIKINKNDRKYLRSEEHTSELQSREISYAVFCLKKKSPTDDTHCSTLHQ